VSQAAAAGLRAVFLPRWPDNPYQDLLASGLGPLGVRVESLPRAALWLPAVLRRGRPDVVHLHAPDHFVVYAGTAARAGARLAVFAAQLRALRAVGTRVVWTAHDVVNHEGRYPRLDRACRRLTGAVAGAVVVHCAEARRQVVSRFGVGAEKVFVIPHGHYRDAYPDSTLDRGAARDALGLPRGPRVLLFLGNLRRHKGLGQLVDAFAALHREDARLVIAGQPFTPDVGDEIVARIRGIAGVDFRPGWVPAAEVSVYMRAADAVVCPFTSSLTSGSVALAMSFGRACIAPRLGCLPEMLDASGALVYDPGRAGALGEALRAALDDPAALEAMGRRNREAIERHAWPAIGRATLEVYRWCLTRENRRRSDTGGPAR
jgi:glycosyltransferase involved in cell wall biosynthesis